MKARQPLRCIAARQCATEGLVDHASGPGFRSNHGIISVARSGLITTFVGRNYNWEFAVGVQQQVLRAVQFARSADLRRLMC